MVAQDSKRAQGNEATMRPAKRVRVAAEDAEDIDEEEEVSNNPPQPSDLYLDTVRHIYN